MDRRSFLKRASIGAALSVPSLASAAHAWEPTETPEFMAAAEAFLEACRRHKPALAAKKAAVERYSAIAPTLPEQLLTRNNMHWPDGTCTMCSIAEREVDVESNTVWPEKGFPRHVMSASGLKDELGYLRRSSKAKVVRELLKLAVSYENAVERAKIDSGAADAIEALYWAADDVRRTASALLEAEPRTQQGLAIMAAAAAYPLEGLGYAYSFPQFYGDRLAKAITRLFGEGDGQ